MGEKDILERVKSVATMNGYSVSNNKKNRLVLRQRGREGSYELRIGRIDDDDKIVSVNFTGEFDKRDKKLYEEVIMIN